jgi:hypothetical protein
MAERADELNEALAIIAALRRLKSKLKAGARAGDR